LHDHVADRCQVVGRDWAKSWGAALDSREQRALAARIEKLRRAQRIGNGALLAKVSRQLEGIGRRLENVEPLFETAFDRVAPAQAKAAAVGLQPSLGLLVESHRQNEKPLHWLMS
jgi:hypothetical protein